MSGPRKPTPAPEPLPETVLGLLLAVAGPQMAQAALPILRERMKLTPEKLAAILRRLIQPDWIPGETEEAMTRGMSPQTLRDMKTAKELPAVISGGRQ